MVLVLLGIVKGASLLTELLERRPDVAERIATAPGVRRYVDVRTPADHIVDTSNMVAATTTATPTNPIATPQPDSNALLLRNKAEALAALVHAGKVGETEGIKLVFGCAPSSSNPRYLAARAALKEELAKLQPPPAPAARVIPMRDNGRERMVEV